MRHGLLSAPFALFFAVHACSSRPEEVNSSAPEGAAGTSSDGGASGTSSSDPGGSALGSGGDSVESGGATADGEGGSSAASADAGDAGEPFAGHGGSGESPSSESGAGGALAPDCVDPLALPLLREAPRTLAETGLYASGSVAPEEVASYVEFFQPQYELWSDGAAKKRFVYLPACSQVDTSQMDYWKFPVGVRFWKEFRRDGQLVETRFIHRFGPGENDWLFVPYQWDPNELTPDKAERVDNGVPNANGTPHDIPSRRDCETCHVNLPEPPLAFSALQLSHSLPGVTLRSLGEAGWLTRPATRDYAPPGDERARAGLGYLHANCGHCHNSYFRTAGNSLPNDPAPRFRLSVNDVTVETTTTYTTLVSVGTFNPAYRDYKRIEPCNPGLSSVLLRMLVRTDDQMPPLATELVDETGVETVRAFLRHLNAPGVPACPE